MKTIEQINKKVSTYSKRLNQTVSLHDYLSDKLDVGINLLCKILRYLTDKLQITYNMAKDLLKSLAGNHVLNLQTAHKEFLESELKARTAAKIDLEYLANRMENEMNIIEEEVKNA